MKEGDRIRLNEKYMACGEKTIGCVGIVKNILDSVYIQVHFITGYCAKCQGENELCRFRLNEVDLILEHNRNGANG